MSEHNSGPGGRQRSEDSGSGRATITAGRIAGVRVGVNWSVLVIFGLIAYLLSAQRFPTAYPGHGVAAYVAAGLLAAVVFLLSLLAHEISHALLARRNGQEVEGITLWMFGGVARLHGEARNPAAELRIAGIGPLVSLVLGIVFTGIAAVLVAAGVSGLVAGAVGWLGAINIALAVFNAIPAAPLDGGRLLRAFLWWRTGDPLKAAVWASRAGQAFGWFLVAVGVFSLFTGGFGGLWLALIGWFMISAASIEGQQAVIRGRLASIPVWQVMTPEPVTAPADITIAEFFDEYLLRHRHTAFPVVNPEGEPIGFVTFDRVKDVRQDERDRTLIADICQPLTEVARTSPEESVADLLPRLGERPEGRALVFARERLVGIVSPRDVSRTLERMSRFGDARSAWGR